MDRGTAQKVRPEHEPLVKELSALPDKERRAIVAAAETAARSRRAVASWKTIRKLTGAISLGGNAVEDCDRLYDG
jgi:hypothetical protein